MAAQVDPKKCTMCGGTVQPLCVEVCPDSAIRVQDGRVVVTEFLCEDCNECGQVCPDRAIQVPLEKVSF
ncbi:MAG: ferredoxin [Planctomycetes bacterium]|nr:ferredoxin [Planctomycetota bacterium]